MTNSYIDKQQLLPEIRSSTLPAPVRSGIMTFAEQMKQEGQEEGLKQGLKDGWKKGA